MGEEQERIRRDATRLGLSVFPEFLGVSAEWRVPGHYILRRETGKATIFLAVKRANAEHTYWLFKEECGWWRERMPQDLSNGRPSYEDFYVYGDVMHEGFLLAMMFWRVAMRLAAGEVRHREFVVEDRDVKYFDFRGYNGGPIRPESFAHYLRARLKEFTFEEQMFSEEPPAIESVDSD